MSNFETLQKYTIAELRVTLSNLGGAPNNKKKNEEKNIALILLQI